MSGGFTKEEAVTNAPAVFRFDGPPPAVRTDPATGLYRWACFCGDAWTQSSDRDDDPAYDAARDAENTAWVHRMGHFREAARRCHPCQVAGLAGVDAPCTLCGLPAADARHLTDHGEDLRKVVVGALVRFEGEDDDDRVTARVVRLDTPTFGVVEVQPCHGQGQAYRALFSALNVVAVLHEDEVVVRLSGENPLGLVQAS